MQRCSTGPFQQPGVGLSNRISPSHLRQFAKPLHNHRIPSLTANQPRKIDVKVQVQASLWSRLGSIFRRKNPEEESGMPIERKDATLVLGASGRTGRLVVKKLLDAGEVVVAGVRSSEKALAAFAEVGVTEGAQKNSKGALFVQEGVDITDEKVFNEELFAGVERVIFCAGRGPQDSESEFVDAAGVKNVAMAAKNFFPSVDTSPKQILSMASEKDLAKWERLDDVIMGGQSESKLALTEDGSGALFTGKVIVEGGGFCGQRTVSLNIEDLSDYDGIVMQVKGDGQIYKMSIKTKPQENIPESTYQATFETVDGQWCDVRIPWHEFVPVKRAKYDPDESPIDPANVKRFALVSSRFDFNSMANPKFSPEPFSLEVQGGIGVYKAVRPRIVLLSTAGVERNARIGDDKEKRKTEIPIVKLNPGGVLNYKYEGENALRNSGVPYTVVRATGFRDGLLSSLLEASQGDTYVGVITRSDVADVLVQASQSPGAAYKTFEVRRGESVEMKGKKMSEADYRSLFLKQVHDWKRVTIGLPPFPTPVPPPAPVTEKEKEEILEDVKKVRERLEAQEAKEAQEVKEVQEATA